MKDLRNTLLRPTVICGASVLALACGAYAQTLINLGAQARNVDFSNAPSTRPVKTGGALPASCSMGDLFFKTAAPAGQNLYGCTAANTWTLMSSSGNGNSGLSDPGSNGLVVRTAPNSTIAVPAPTGVVVGTTDVQTLTNKSISASQINSGTLPAAQMPSLSGDVSTSTGSTVTSLATVNANPGTYGDATHSVQLTVDAKGRITTIGQTPTNSGLSSGLNDPGANGLVVRTAQNTTTSIAAPTGAVVGTTDVQTLTNKSISASQINSGTLATAQMPSFSGDVSTSAGSTVTALATVNSNPGSYGDATHSVQVTVDGKGRITAIGQTPTNSGLPDPGTNGLVVRTAQNTTASIAAPTGAVVGTTDVQTLTNKSISASQINSGTLAAAQMPAFSGDVSTPAGSTATTLTTVNSNPGTYGDATHSVQVTVDAKGRITAIGQSVIAGGGASITTGLLGSIPATCSAGALYFATDQPAGQQIYTCSATNVWTQIGNLGGSGALAYTGGSLDIVTSVVPRLAAANSFTGANTFTRVGTGSSSNTDLAGRLTLSGGSASFTFTGSYATAPICTASDTTAANAVKVTTTTTSLTLNGTGTDVVNYICIARN